MKTYISLLRGINVSGQKIIRMEALRKSYEKLGFQKVRTYVQSGNVIFVAPDAAFRELENRIAKQIEKDFAFIVPVLVLDEDKLHGVIRSNPFLYTADKDENYLHVTFLSATPCGYDIAAIEAKKMSGEEIIIRDDVVYLYCPNGYGRTKLNNNFLESKLRVNATTRNWKTVVELGKMDPSTGSG